MVCEHVEDTIEPETLIVYEVTLARTRKLASHIVPYQISLFRLKSVVLVLSAKFSTYTGY